MFSMTYSKNGSKLEREGVRERKGKVLSLEQVIKQCERIRDVVLPSPRFEMFDFKKLRKSRFKCFFQRVEDHVVGYIVFEVFPEKRNVVVHSFAVLPEFRNKGFCSGLLKALLSWVSTKRYSKIKVGTMETDTGYRALELFVRHGFHITKLGRYGFWDFGRGYQQVDLEYVVAKHTTT